MLKRDSLVNRCVKEILSMIFGGLYPSGGKLPGERVLCCKLGISRTTLRECLARLREMGVIEQHQGRGTRVKRFSRRMIPADYRQSDYGEVALDEIIVARAALETAAAEQAARRMTPAALRHLGKLLERMSDEGIGLADFIKADMEFHRAIIQGSGNRVLLTAFDAIRPFHKYSQLATSYLSNEARSTIAHHHRILAALKTGQSRRLATAILDHMNDMKRYVRRKSGSGGTVNGRGAYGPATSDPKGT